MLKLCYRKKGATKHKYAIYTSQTNNNYLYKLPWLWLLSGILIGVLISSSVFIKFTPVPKRFSANTIIAEKNFKEEIPEKIVPKFDFYTELPQMEPSFIINNVKVAKEPVLEDKYVLQIGTFNTLQDADGLRAKLMLIGFDASIEDIKLKDSMQYRVIMGPFNSEVQVLSKQKSLAEKKIIDTLILKRNK